MTARVAITAAALSVKEIEHFPINERTGGLNKKLGNFLNGKIWTQLIFYMTANRTHNLTKEQLTSILESSYCLINNWGGHRFHYMPNSYGQDESEAFLAFRNDTGETYKFSTERARIIHDGAYLQVTNTADGIQYMFIVLGKIDLEKFV